MRLRYFFILFSLFFIAVSPAAGQGTIIADFDFSNTTDMPTSLLNNSVEGALDAVSIHPLARSDGEGVYTLDDPTTEEHENIELEIPRELLAEHKTIFLEFDFKDHETSGGWLIYSGDVPNFGIWHHRDQGFRVQYQTLDDTQAGAAAVSFRSEFIPYPLDSGQRALIQFHYIQDEGIAYLYKDRELIWKTTDSIHPETGENYEPTPGYEFYWPNRNLVVASHMNAGRTETPTLYRFRAFPEACSDSSPPTIVEEETVTTVCSGEQATLVATANDAEGYQWYQGPSSSELTKIEEATNREYVTEPLSAADDGAKFWVKVIRGPCESDPAMVAVTVKESPEKPQASDVESCGPAALELQASSNEANVTFQWYKSSGESMEAIPGETGSSYTTELLTEPAVYYVKTVNENNCESEPRMVQAIIHEVPAEAPEVENTDILLCGPEEVEVSVQPDGNNYTYNWYKTMEKTSLIEEKTNNTIKLQVSKDTSFYVRAVNGDCVGENATRIEISISQKPGFELSASDTVLLQGFSTSLTAEFDPDSVDESSIKWKPAHSLEQPFSKTSMASPTATTTYTVYAESVDGCLLSDTITIYVVDEFPVTNAFSPNGDGYQDTWEIHTLDNDKYKDCKIVVYNGWGNRVFYSEGYDKSKEWDGTANGQPLPAGTYYYTIILNDSQEPLRGSLFIMR